MRLTVQMNELSWADGHYDLPLSRGRALDVIFEMYVHTLAEPGANARFKQLSGFEYEFSGTVLHAKQAPAPLLAIEAKGQRFCAMDGWNAVLPPGASPGDTIAGRGMLCLDWYLWRGEFESRPGLPDLSRRMKISRIAAFPEPQVFHGQPGWQEILLEHQRDPRPLFEVDTTNQVGTDDRLLKALVVDTHHHYGFLLELDDP